MLISIRSKDRINYKYNKIYIVFNYLFDNIVFNLLLNLYMADDYLLNLNYI